MFRDANGKVSDELSARVHISRPHPWQHLKAKLNLFRSDEAGLQSEIDRLHRENSELEPLRTENARLQEENSNLQAQIETLHLKLTVDPLTGLLNRAGLSHLIENLEKDVANKELSGKGCIIAIDLDRFKRVNDVHGHDVGDEVLVAVAQELMDIKLVSAIAEVVRTGGDEFAIVVLDRRHTYGGHPAFGERRSMTFEDYILKRFTEALERAAIKLNLEKNTDIGISEGYAFFRNVTELEIELAFKDADTASYHKKSGLGEFLACHARMDQASRYFANKILGFTFNPDTRGDYEIDRSVGFAAHALDKRFGPFLSQLSPRALHWMVTEIPTSRTQGDQAMSR